MNSISKQLIIGVSVLIAFIGVGVFGFLPFAHQSHSEAPMVDCPYAENNFSICNSPLEHISNWQQLSNVILPVLLLLSIIFFFILLVFNKDFLNQRQFLYKWKYYLEYQKSCSYREKILSWLALFENSPSLARARHSF